ncbi:MAG TPA: patatin-like phospholipase family protein [Burkholderiales bacterium]|nr:patatin-like phospholipase family protein [Burkholderiales bacterium]
MINRTFSVFALAALLTCNAAQAACGERAPGDSRPRVGLALSGGGARGAAHIGVLKALEQLRIPIDCIAATSMGALVGGTYAAGTSPEEMEARIVAVNWNDILTDRPPREDLPYRRKQDEVTYLRLELGMRGADLLYQRGVINGQKIDLLFRELAAGAFETDNFDRLRIPFRAVATDAENGRMTVFSAGDLATVMRASMSVPGGMAPAQIGERIYLDGGLTRNLPVDVVREMGADVVIAVNLGTPLLKREDLGSLLGITLQMINILTEQNVQAQLDSLKAHDILISPELGNLASTDFEQVASMIPLGEGAVLAASDALRRYSLPEKEYAARLKKQRRIVVKSPFIDEVRVEGLNRVNPKLVKAAIDVKPGDVEDPERIRKSISRLYGRGDFERLNYRVLQEGGKRVLQINGTEKSWGPDYLRFGLGLSSDFEGDAAFNLLVSHQQTWLNALGADWKNEVQIGQVRRYLSEFRQPFDETGYFFISPRIEGKRQPVEIFEGDRRVAQYQVTTNQVGLDVGVQLDRYGEARVGYVRGDLNARTRIGAANLPDFDARQGAITFNAAYDQTDSARFISTGNLGALSVYSARKRFGSDDEYTKLEANWTSAFKVDANTLIATVRLGRTLDGEAPIYDPFTLGGFLKLSGYRNGQFIGQELDLAQLLYFRRIGRLPAAFGDGLYAGMSFEMGRLAPGTNLPGTGGVKRSLGVYFGADSLLGPLYLGAGKAVDGDWALYLFLGEF